MANLIAMEKRFALNVIARNAKDFACFASAEKWTKRKIKIVHIYFVPLSQNLRIYESTNYLVAAVLSSEIRTLNVRMSDDIDGSQCCNFFLIGVDT